LLIRPPLCHFDKPLKRDAKGRLELALNQFLFLSLFF